MELTESSLWWVKDPKLTRFRHARTRLIDLVDGLGRAADDPKRAPSSKPLLDSSFNDWEISQSRLACWLLTLVPAYQHIIGMGESAVPLMLRELRDDPDPDHWFSALKAITEADPVPDEVRGNVKAMADAWVAWGEQEGYLTDELLGSSRSLPASQFHQ